MNGHADFAAALLDPAHPCPAGLVAWNGSDPASRFAVYRNNVVVSLVDALADSFPVTLATVGDAFFRALAREFVFANPPRSPLLSLHGRGFADFVATFAPAASVPWLADLARLEMLRIEAYHAADAEPLPAAAIAALLAEPERLPGLHLRCHPSAAILCSPWAVHSLWVAHQGDRDPSAVDPCRPESVLIVRSGGEVATDELPQAVVAFVAALMRGENLAAAAQAGQSVDGGFDLALAFATLLHRQIIVTVDSGSGGQDHERHA
ncbi:DNA-binding domain-containing protein [Aromatoleum petrolei]|uniref:DUF2063 domain-containing protein n=1 Tax=Aromatoleum petrolei TaxID=76116 RepID=A0ABX1MG36_9RHOO|nr:DNA-binding domain-containing protein [Aromatoleum petrolei]NMF86903.1 DUF2063 domain-containing protein [Aromatoleum petrolei]QTQ37492.1 putative protein Duf2063 [Aromatoleum petrolei]